jgi:hypothetical protein
VDDSLEIGGHSPESLLDLARDFALESGDGVEVAKLVGLVEGDGLVGDLLPIDDVEVHLPEVALVADADGIEAGL